MCGIVAAIADRDVSQILLNGLKRLEYRGYDSAGLVMLNGAGLQRKRTVGKVNELVAAFNNEPFEGLVGLAHTRWATHGKPSESNAHPHFSHEKIAIVHNGIIENYKEIQANLVARGYEFQTETDSEVIAHQIHAFMKEGKDFFSAVVATVKILDGAFALGALCLDDPQRFIVARKGAPVVIGLGAGENFVASDPLALLPETQNFIYLEDGDIAEVQRNQVIVHDASGKEVQRQIHHLDLKQDAIDKGSFRHFMLKEIMEQPKVIAATLIGRVSKKRVLEEAFGVQAAKLFDKTRNVQIVACGTSFHAGLVARYWLESVSIPCQVEVASEFRYRQVTVPENTLLVVISQSGETADTLAALRQAKQQNYLGSLAICNVPESSLVREADLVFMTQAGVEIGVASTKAFTTQLTALLLLSLVLGRRHGLSAEQEAHWVQELEHLPAIVEQTLELDGQIKNLAQNFANKQHALFLGRGSQYPIALEGALKLKEISYIHAEAYPAGELKHGPLALVDKEMPVVAVAPNNQLLEKLISNLHEVRARGGELFVFGAQGTGIQSSEHLQLIQMPAVSDLLAPIVYTIPLQLLAYHVAVLKGTDVDQPRNLAKSVTVE